MERNGGVPLVTLTAYTTPMARLVGKHCDVTLVGDSVGMVLHGLPTTLGVTLEMMIMHGKTVVRGTTSASVVIDMPFGTYEKSPAQAFANAARIIAETGAAAVKLEGGYNNGRDHCLFGGAWRACDGAYWPDAASREHIGRL